MQTALKILSLEKDENALQLHRAENAFSISSIKFVKTFNFLGGSNDVINKKLQSVF